MATQENDTKNENKFSEIIMSLVGGFVKNLSLDVVLSAREKIREKLELFLEKIKNGIIVGVTSILGIIFFALGISFLIGSFWEEIPGIGFIIVGVFFVFTGWGFSMKK